jgi:hypothetical protein
MSGVVWLRSVGFAAMGIVTMAASAAAPVGPNCRTPPAPAIASDRKRLARQHRGHELRRRAGAQLGTIAAGVAHRRPRRRPAAAAYSPRRSRVRSHAAAFLLVGSTPSPTSGPTIAASRSASSPRRNRLTLCRSSRDRARPSSSPRSSTTRASCRSTDGRTRARPFTVISATRVAAGTDARSS